MSSGSVLGAVFTAIVGLLVFSYQKYQDRRHQIMAERRKLYEAYGAAMSPLMFRLIDPKSPEHFGRLKAINEMAARLEVISSGSVSRSHQDLMRHLSRKLHGKYSDGEVEFFDNQALHLYEATITEMRKDALPRSLW